MSTTFVTGFMFCGLVSLDPNTLEPIPELVERWEFLSGTRIRFFLRKDARWSDGMPLTARDVKFTFDIIYSDEILSSARDIFTINGRQIRVECVDDHTVDFILPAPFAPFISSMTQEILPEHILAKPVREGRFNQMWSQAADPRSIVCNGPFVLDTYIPGERIVLKRNPFYYKSRPNDIRPRLDGIVIRIVQNPNTALLMFLNQEMDILDLSTTDYALLKRMSRGFYDLYNLGPSTASQFLAFNLNPRAPLKDEEKAIFADLRFRQAVAHSIDRDGIIEAVYDGIGYHQYGPLTEANGFFYNHRIHRLTYDKKKAAGLLDRCGLQDNDNDGFRDFPNSSERIRLSIATNADAQARVDIAGLIASDLRDIGLFVNVAALDFNNLVLRLTNTFDWQMALIGLTGGFEPHFGRNVWHSKGALHFFNPTGEPIFEWEKEVDKIFDEAVLIYGRDERKILYDRWQQMISKELPVVFLAAPARIVAVNKRIKGIAPSKYLGVLYNIDEIAAD